MGKIQVIVFGVLAACSTSNGMDESSDNAPTCQDALKHYYGAGCAYYDQFGNQIELATMIGNCETGAAATPSECQPKLDAWLECDASVSSPATNADCDCSQTYMALLTCQ